ncbi:MAG: glycosyltransferase family 2 protein [bacterium]
MDSQPQVGRLEHPVLLHRESTCNISVIIVNWNTYELLEKCLESIYNQTINVTYEVIVVDNGSTDGSCEMVQVKFPQTILIRNEKNEGFAFACNKGMRQANGHYFLLLNSDTIIVNDAISQIVQYMDENQRAGAGGCGLLNPDGSLQPACGWFPTLYSILANFNPIGKLSNLIQKEYKYFPPPFLSYQEHLQEQDVDWIVGACIIVRREAVEQAGLMDETMFFYAEEWDWCYRIKKNGWHIIYTPNPKIIHIGGGSTVVSLANRVSAILNGQQYFYQKHLGFIKASIIKLMILVGALGKGTFWSVLYILYFYSPDRRKLFLNKIKWHIYVLRWVFSLQGD